MKDAKITQIEAKAQDSFLALLHSLNSFVTSENTLGSKAECKIRVYLNLQNLHSYRIESKYFFIKR